MDLKNARILVANDDGVGAEGIAVLEAIARGISDDVWVVAPEHEQSGAGHSLTMHDPIRYRQLAEKKFVVSGTPTDCVLMASMVIMKDRQPDLLLSGVNRGMNVAEDVTYSGTIAAAMEGTLLDIPSIALSTRLFRDTPVAWGAVEHFAPDIIRTLTKRPMPAGTLMNVNFPGIPVDQVKGIKACPQGRRKIAEKLEKRTDPRGRDYYWMGSPSDEPYDDLPGADYHQLHAGYITISPLAMDLTDYRLLEEIREQLEAEREGAL
jgi:5'-nucleotidase